MTSHDGQTRSLMTDAYVGQMLYSRTLTPLMSILNHHPMRLPGRDRLLPA